MNKPFSIIVEETKQELISVINKSNLHPTALEMIVKDIYLEINRLSTETKTKEREQYIQASLVEASQNAIEDDSVDKVVVEPTEK